jgi:hypothetical protein
MVSLIATSRNNQVKLVLDADSGRRHHSVNNLARRCIPANPSAVCEYQWQLFPDSTRYNAALAQRKRRAIAPICGQARTGMTRAFKPVQGLP